VQADGGLAGARCALHAHGGGDVSAHDLVLLGLDRRDDVAHGAHPGALDLTGQDRAAPVGLGDVGEVLVLVRRDLAEVDAEAPTKPHAHRLGPAGPIERAGHVRAPVDDHRVAGLVGDVPAPEVPALRRAAAAGGGGVRGVDVDPAEEQRGRRVVDQRRRTPVQGGGEVLAGDPVATLGAQRQRALAHPGQLAAGQRQVGPLGGQGVGLGRRHEGRC
jgi:hypothetical protein